MHFLETFTVLSETKKKLTKKQRPNKKNLTNLKQLILFSKKIFKKWSYWTENNS